MSDTYPGGRDLMFGRLTVATLILTMTVSTGSANTTVYAAGVLVGERFTYGQYQTSWNATGSPFSLFQNISTATLLVTNVSSPLVTAMVKFNFTDGTPSRSSLLQGDLSTGAGNLGIFIIAGGLNPGDSVPTSVSSLTINTTLIKSYAGVYRTANVRNATVSTSSEVRSERIFWDKETGVLLEAGFNESRTSPSPGHGFLHYVLTGTSGWPSAPSPTIFGLAPLVLYAMVTVVIVIAAISLVLIKMRRHMGEQSSETAQSSP